MKTIMIVDDEISLTRIIRSNLQSRGYNAVAAKNGIEALERLKDIKPDLIVLDINMPEMGGIEFYKEISLGHGEPQYPIVFLTARSELKDLVVKEMQCGFLEKPFTIDNLIEEIDKVLGVSDQ